MDTPADECDNEEIEISKDIKFALTEYPVYHRIFKYNL